MYLCYRQVRALAGQHTHAAETDQHLTLQLHASQAATTQAHAGADSRPALEADIKVLEGKASRQVALFRLSDRRDVEHLSTRDQLRADISR